MLLQLYNYINDFVVTIFIFILSFLFLITSPLFAIINLIRVKTFKDHKNIIITGACGGLGSQLALYYSKPGRNISLFGINNDKLINIKNKCIEKGANVEINIVDITDRDLLKEKLVDFDNRNPIDLLFANAGVIECQLPNDLDFEEKIQKVIQVNVNGLLNTVLPLVPRFEKRKSGQIVIVSSLSCYVDWFYTGYSSSKSFCISFGLNLRKKLSKFGVGVTVVTPGYMQTPMLNSIGKIQEFVSVERACEAINNGIQMNHSQIFFPLDSFIITFMTNLVSPNFREPVSNIIEFLKNRSNKKKMD
ncbi:hypothetical protein DICPUDRAFT_153204 [Dictyostelium purpureum]|uniref:Uncharacterized protein n=1 Tax=Dictyostelium purpureum TaxID=5786 RepID=F0ZNB1_DICPU|nr:uncharacterized protein DICPUDRAFT_153204 [Dictyostelium purpureum]EGC34583.1 hypothetical protein DICPUDRAFT_153204 [Dictyostelium purpureum]|eukprot:XP_003288907.1 hypothetical protein DICPUDRAFT_153204 [Dictyostelium purpureum]